MKRRPKITSPCVADRFHAAGERIAEVSFPNGKGCLLRLQTLSDGTALIHVYRADPDIEVGVLDAHSNALARVRT